MEIYYEYFKRKMNKLKLILNDKKLINSCKGTILDFWSKINRSQRFYFLGLFLLIIGIFGLTFHEKRIVIFGCIILFCGLISDILYCLSYLLKTMIGKIIIVILSSFLLTIGYAWSDQLVNMIVGYDISGIKYTTKIVAILLIPVIVPFLSIAIIILLIVISPIVVVIYSDKGILRFFKNSENYSSFTTALRLLSGIIICSLLLGISDSVSRSYSEFLKDNIKSLVYNLDAYHYSRCSNIQEEAKVIPVNENEIIMVLKREDDYKFIPMYCEPKIKKTND
jgi:hypothetical protein